MRSISAAIVAVTLSACSGFGNRSADWWVPVDPGSLPAQTRVIQQAKPGKNIVVTSAYAFGRQGTLVCGTASGDPFVVYIDEQSRIHQGKIEDNPCR